MNEATLESQIACNEFSHHRYAVYITVLTTMQLIWSATTVPILKEASYKDPKYLGERTQYPQASSVQGQKGSRTGRGSLYSTFLGKGTCS